jgi:hypothetical protein
MSAPGCRFLGVVDALFDEHTVATIFRPAVADFQDEVLELDANLPTKLFVRCRWYVALAVLLVVTPFSLSRPPVAVRPRSMDGDASILLLYAPLIAGAWWCVQLFAGTAVVAGVILACVLHAWNQRHPSVVALSIGQHERPARVRHQPNTPRAVDLTLVPPMSAVARRG